MPSETLQSNLGPFFGEGFLEDHAGRIISEPRIAVVELVANCWDAGASNVEITWPEKVKGQFQIVDDGTGMAKKEFENIWLELSYNRVLRQGPQVKFPDPATVTKRAAYGRNGKGRHSLFCFTNEYFVETWKNGISSTFSVNRNYQEEGSRNASFNIKFVNQIAKEGHGTRIYCTINKNYVTIDEVKELMGTKFITDPSFSINLNGHKIELFDSNDIHEELYDISGEGIVRILRLDSKSTGRTSKQHGVAWWVNNRLVGEHSWKGLDGSYLDARTSEAKRYTFIVIADFLIDEVKADWTDFKDTPRAKNIVNLINSYILKSIQNLMQDVRIAAKKSVLVKHKQNLKQLSNLSKDQVGNFIDEVQLKCPTMTQEHLSNTVEILTNIELTRTGFKLLQQLVQLAPDDLNTLSDILDKWSINEAKLVLEELQWRLRLIEKMEILIENVNTDELHDLQPLFEKGLWIFGPEFEGLQFTSNLTLSTVLKKFFGGGIIDHERRRPDFIALPNASLGVYSSDDFDENGEVCGFKKILIIELKRGGASIKINERRQAEDYATALYNSGKLSPNTKIVCYVLGAKIECECINIGENIDVFPRAYSIILRQANARTFNLIKKIKYQKEISECSDKEISEVLSQQEVTDFQSKASGCSII